MLTPGGFAHLALTHGTVATVSDPHEIANVLGVEGVNYMIDEAAKVPLKFHFGAPSCVPATHQESSGAEIKADEIEKLLERNDIHFLSEMMNFPGVINNAPEVLKKMKHAQKSGKPIDGHAPGLRGVPLEAYVRAGITTDHECTDLEEALEKVERGMIIQIREGSAAKDFETLHSLIDLFPGQVMLCTDDIHPDDLKQGHINKIVSRGLRKNLDLFNVLNAAITNPIRHYKLDVGMLQIDDPADFIVVDNLEAFNILQTVIDGEVVYKDEKVAWPHVKPSPINRFNTHRIRAEDIQVPDRGQPLRIIKAFDGELYTKGVLEWPEVHQGMVVSDTRRDTMKMVVLNRYEAAVPAVGFITGFGMKDGAIGSSIAHDSHNIIAIGANDDALVRVINEIVEMKGGLAILKNGQMRSLKLDVAGIMSAEKPADLVAQYQEINRLAQSLCPAMSAPFMTLSFMSLLVIPELKLSDRGLFDVPAFEIVSLFKE
jgi:adenine deaminase